MFLFANVRIFASAAYMSLTRIKDAFFAWGWLSIAFFPVIQLAGRFVLLLACLLYFAWAMFSLAGTKAELDRRLAAYYALLMAAFFLGIPGAEHPMDALLAWSRYLAYTTIFWWVYATLQHTRNGMERLVGALAVAGILLTVLLYVKLFFEWQRPEFIPSQHMREDNLPWLMPFMLHWLSCRARLPYGRYIAAAVLAAGGWYIVASEGRAALVGLVVALFGYAIFVLRWRPWAAGLGTAVVLIAAITASGSGFFRSADAERPLSEVVDVMTSYRTALWRQAIASPPPNPWTGIGMGNLSAYESVMTVQPANSVPLRLGHLHNFAMDAWYETGLIGLIALLWWLAQPLARGLRAWFRTHGTEAGALLAAAAAILANGTLSYSYNSMQFTLYLFALLAALASAQFQTREVTRTSPHAVPS